MLEEVARLTIQTDDGRQVEAHGVSRLVIELDDAEAVRNGARTSVVQAEERGFDSHPPLQPTTFGGSAAGRHGNHVRWRRFDPVCGACIAANRSDDRSDRREPSQRSNHAQIAAIAANRSDIDDIDDDRSSIVDSPSDLPLSHAVLLRKYSRGRQREAHVSESVIARIRAVMACPEGGHEDRWCAAILDTARGNAVARLEETHRQLHAPPAPDPDVQAEAIEADRRRQAYVLRQQLEQGVDEVGRPLSDLARQVAQRQLTRLESSQQAQAP